MSVLELENSFAWKDFFEISKVLTQAIKVVGETAAATDRMEVHTVVAETRARTGIMTIIPAGMITTTMAVDTARVDMIQVRRLNSQPS